MGLWQSKASNLWDINLEKYLQRPQSNFKTQLTLIRPCKPNFLSDFQNKNTVSATESSFQRRMGFQLSLGDSRNVKSNRLWACFVFPTKGFYYVKTLSFLCTSLSRSLQRGVRARSRVAVVSPAFVVRLCDRARPRPRVGITMFWCLNLGITLFDL